MLTTLQLSPSLGASDAVIGRLRNTNSSRCIVTQIESTDEPFDFAVGFSRQPLPKGNHFAIITNAGGPGIMATDTATRHGLELAKLRPETLESPRAKLPPTATISMPEDARAGFEKITNGVKQKLPSTRLLGVEDLERTAPAERAHSP